MTSPETGDHFNPSYYRDNKVAGRECIELTHRMSFSAGSVTKYLWRAGRKPGEAAEKDYRKALWYLNRLATSHESTWVHGRAPGWFREWRLDAKRELGDHVLLSTIDLLEFTLYRQAHLELADYIKENFPA